MWRQLIVGMVFSLSVLKPDIAQADSDGYYCVGPGYIAYQFGMAAPPVAAHELFIVRLPDWTRQTQNMTHLSRAAATFETERRSLLIDREGNEYVLLITAAPASVRECPPVVSARVVEIDPGGFEVRAQLLYSGTLHPCSRRSLAPYTGDGSDPRDPLDTLLGALLFGPYGPTDVTPYSGDLRSEFQVYLTRADAYETSRPPVAGREGQMVDAARTAYERRLFAVAVVPNATALAVDYVERLRPCYEWEGSSECPQREALFADAYRDSEPDSPFLPYLLLLSAHRWLCAAEAFERESRPLDAIRSRQSAAERLAAASSAEQLMIRTAAERLAADGRCSPRR